MLLQRHASHFASYLSDAQLNDIGRCATHRVYRAGDTICNAIDSANFFFVLLSGSVELEEPIIHSHEGYPGAPLPGSVTRFKDVTAGHGFSHLPLVMGAALYGYTARVLDADEDEGGTQGHAVAVMRIAREDYNTILRRSVDKELQATVLMLSKMEMFSDWSDPALSRLYFTFKRKVVGKGQDIVRQGDAAESCFIIRSGRCDVLVRPPQAAMPAPAAVPPVLQAVPSVLQGGASSHEGSEASFESSKSAPARMTIYRCVGVTPDSSPGGSPLLPCRSTSHSARAPAVSASPAVLRNMPSPLGARACGATTSPPTPHRSVLSPPAPHRSVLETVVASDRAASFTDHAIPQEFSRSGRRWQSAALTPFQRRRFGVKSVLEQAQMQAHETAAHLAGMRHVATLPEGSLVGEIALLSEGAVRNATVRR